MKSRAKHITIEVRGSHADGGNVRLEEFIEQLDVIRNALRETERSVTHRDPDLYYRIIDMKHQSPATVVIEAASGREGGTADSQLAGAVVRYFTTNLRFISRKSRAPRTANVPVLETYREMTAPLQKHITEVVIRSGEHSVVINNKFRDAIEHVLGPEESSYGSISGRLEALNLHNTFKFSLYPTVGPSKVTGKFKRKLRTKFTNAIDKYVTVYGLLRYKTWDKFPYAVIAEDIVVHTDPPATTLADLKGMAPAATGDLTSVEFLDQIRNEDRQA
jgi:hypothetical protein